MCIFNNIANLLKMKNSNYLHCYCARFRLRSSLLLQSNFLLFYNSIRYQRIFNIIELLKRFIIELQIKFLCIYFKD